MTRRATRSAPEADSEERLMIEAAQRDPGRFADLYEHNFERVYSYIARRVPDRHAAQDLTADVFHQALRNLAQFEWRGRPFVAWLVRIAANAIADNAARLARERRVPVPEGPEEIELEEIHHRAALYRLVDRLPADQRRVIHMRFTEQKSIREIAHALGRSEGAVKQLQLRGLDNLRTRMGGKNG